MIVKLASKIGYICPSIWNFHLPFKFGSFKKTTHYGLSVLNYIVLNIIFSIFLVYQRYI